ncbi:MAG TPA: hypothetical protein VF381_06155 [Thermoanaerobaculia bacterium]
MKRKLIAVVLCVLATAAVAQERVPVQPPVFCPHPIVLDIQGEKSPPTQDPADLPASIIPLTAGSVWNQTAINKSFADTFHFKLPGECCVWTKGTLTIEVKALQGGPAGSSTSANDGVTVFSNKVMIPPQASPWSAGVATGATKTLTFNIPAPALAHGEVSFYVEDDTAVVWAHLHLEGCCIH